MMTLDTGPQENDYPSIGEKIRVLRKGRNLTLTEFAQQCEISPSFLSQIERDQANPSIGTLHIIAQAFDLTMAQFFSEPGQNDAPSPAEETIAKVVRANQRKVIIYPGSGTRNELLSPDLRGKIQMTWTVMAPGADTGEDPFIHEGEECGIILQGKLETWVGDERYVLGPGDAIYHPSSLPHSSRNIGDKDVIMITASTPPSF